MKISKAFPSRFIKAADLDGKPQVFTILTVNMEMIGQGSDAEEKPIVFFDETDQGLVLNKTNANMITELLGTDETNGWKGKRICLYPTRVQFGSKMVDSIRVKEAEETESLEKEAEEAFG